MSSTLSVRRWMAFAGGGGGGGGGLSVDCFMGLHTCAVPATLYLYMEKG